MAALCSRLEYFRTECLESEFISSLENTNINRPLNARRLGEPMEGENICTMATSNIKVGGQADIETRPFACQPGVYQPLRENLNEINSRPGQYCVKQEKPEERGNPVTSLPMCMPMCMPIEEENTEPDLCVDSQLKLRPDNFRQALSQ